MKTETFSPAGRIGDQGHTFVVFPLLWFLAGRLVALNVLALVISRITGGFFNKKPNIPNCISPLGKNHFIDWL